MAGKKTSAHNKTLYKTYESSQTWKKNRIAKLERHLEKHPDDAIAQAAVKATQAATAPRRAKYKRKNIGMNDVTRLLKGIDKMLKGAENAAQFEQKKVAAAAQAEKVTQKQEKAKARKPRHKKAAK